MKINSIGPSFGASFVKNNHLETLIKDEGINEKTQDLVKQFTELPYKDKVEITHLYRCVKTRPRPFYDTTVTNKETGNRVSLEAHNLNDVLKTLIDVEERFWNNTEKYNKILDQRNNYLRQIKLENKNPSMLDIWDEQLAEYSFKIYEYRKYFIDKISNSIEDIHSLITKSGKEEIKIKYISNSKDKNSFLENLKKSRVVDIKRGFTATGVHRDDFMIYIDNRPVSIFGSQGQQRTSILTLKLCELKIVKDEIGDSPILLLDDYMSELDEKRRKSFLENIKGNQVIITCTDRIELENENSIYYVENGICKKV